MSEWSACRVGDLCRYVCSGGTPKSSVSEYYEGGTIPWLNTKEIFGDQIYKTERCITEKGLASSSAKWIKANCVVVAMYGATAGQVAIVKIPVTTNQACCNLEIDETKADYRYVFYALRQSYRSLSGLANGGAQQNLNAQIIKDFEIPCPDLPTQRKIAAALGALDDKIELNRKMNANLEAMAQALFKSWFVDFEPFGGQMPEGWRGGTFGDFTTIKRGKVITKDSMTPGAVPVVAAGLAPAYYTDKANVSWPSVTISQSGANAGYVWIHFEDIWASDCSYISKSESPYVYMGYLFLKHNDRRIRHMQHGAAQPHIHADDLLPLEFNVPTKEHADKFTELISPIFERMAVAENQNRTLAQLRDTLLPKLMSGELNVDDVKID